MYFKDKQATIKNIIYFNKDNNYTVVKLAIDRETLTATGTFLDFGNIDSKEKVKNMPCVFTGKMIKHPKYGKQISLENIKILNSETMYFFLANVVKGLGSRLARHLVDKFGEKEIENILENTPEKLLSVKGIKEKKLKKIVASWNKYKTIKQLSDLFSAYNIKMNADTIIRIYKHFADSKRDAIKEINNNPYVLTEIRGIGFKTADKIALQLGIGEHSKERLNAFTEYLLLQRMDDAGDTYITRDVLNQGLIDNGIVTEDNDSEEIVNDILDIVASDDKYTLQETEEDFRIAFAWTLFYEKNIYNFFIDKTKKRSPYTVSQDDFKTFVAKEQNKYHIKLSDKQLKAVKEIALTGSNVFILCGYAGTGKTTVSKIILDYFSQFTNKITCCAFTGMASKRIKDVTGYPSSTIHSLLGYSENGFKHNKDNPLPYDIILVDEASMVNLNIFNSLINAIKDNTVLILVGDDAQLPPIGAGNVFSDLLKEKRIPQVKLDKIYRQSEDSVLTYFASFIRKGKMPPNYNDDYKDFAFYKYDVDKSFYSMDEKEKKAVREELYALIKKDLFGAIKNLITEKAMKQIEAIWNIQIATALKNTPLGTKELNKELQDFLNPNGQAVKIRGSILKTWDKVIHLKNMDMLKISYEEYKAKKQNGNLPLSEYFNDNQKERIYNGALGIVVDIDEEDESFVVIYPDNDYKAILYPFDDYKNNIDLGYALTIHKMQGSQFNYVFMPIVNSFYVMLNNKLTYTGLTRAKEKVFVFGQSFAFKRACTNIKDTQRKTFIRLLIDGEINIKITSNKEKPLWNY